MSDSFTGALTLGLIDPSSPDYGGKMTKEENRREALIKAGMASINAVYGGGTAPQYSLVTKGTKYDPNTTYYRTESGAFKPYRLPGQKGAGLSAGGIGATAGLAAGPIGGFVGGSIGAATEGDLMGMMSGGGTSLLGDLFKHHMTPQEMFNTKVKDKFLFTATPETYKGFGPDFFDQRAKDYVNYAMPQLSDQFSNTQNAIEYGLANKGVLGGSASRKAAADLNKQKAFAQQTVEDTGTSQAMALRDSVEASYQNAINQLYQSANPAGGTQAAIANVARFQQPSAFAPIANMFGTLLNQYATSRFFNPGTSPSYIMPDQSDYNAAGALPKN